MTVYNDLYTRTAAFYVEPSYATENTAKYAYIVPDSYFYLDSPSNSLTDIDYCLHFYYYINGSGPLLQVSHLNSANLEETLFYYNTNTYGLWYQVKVPFHGRANDMLTIYGHLQYSYYGVLAIDQVRLIEGSCPN
uniref:Uncharacterized protein LOC111136928 n=1 Tax=Crassostrea virginica TaxID=6565 RepID=A0A8B8EV07_CRAVI|nr:uncharacterized protein LOC111136928 [Crassostrea virginica]